MAKNTLLFFVVIFINYVISESSVEIVPVTNYEYYENFDIRSGLNGDLNAFYLNGKEIFIYSGALHYFRVPKAYWRDRLRKIRAAGFNAVETVIPWNLHEPRNGEFDFGYNDNDMSDFLDLGNFIYTAQREDLFVIVRVGPYICSDLEFGGLPSWLLKDENINIRTSDPTFLNYVRRYFENLIPILTGQQWSYGGSIIMFQIENQYSISGKHDIAYLRELRQMMNDYGVIELMVTADNPEKGITGTLPDQFLLTGIFDTEPKAQLDMMNKTQPNRPKMVMEYRSGATDFWSKEHIITSLETYKDNYEIILKYPASINVYMFVGGTNFGFLNGGLNLNNDEENSDYYSYISSYDFSALITEAGNYTEKYYATKELLDKYNPIKTKVPAVPAPPEVTKYENIIIEEQINVVDLLKSIDPISSQNVIPMEKLDINGNFGQSYGYIVYRKLKVDIPADGVLKIEGRVFDTVMVLVNGALVSPWLENASDINSTVTSHTKNPEIVLSKNAVSGATLDIIIENWGRVNFGAYKQLKGLWQGGVKINDDYLTDWLIYPLEFKRSWTNNLNNWETVSNSNGPTLYKANLELLGPIQDSFIHMEKWVKGIVIVNGFVLGRYAKMGPIQTLYLPAPLLIRGNNTICIFEHYKFNNEVEFNDQHIYKNY